jgi:glutathione S-transferase
VSAPTLEMWQTEWCPASHRVRQRLTELGLAYIVRQVPVEREDRTELVHRTGERSIPVLVVDGDVLTGSEAILTYLNTHFTEPPEAERQRAKAAMAKRKELERACPELAAVTH